VRGNRHNSAGVAYVGFAQRKLSIRQRPRVDRRRGSGQRPHPGTGSPPAPPGSVCGRGDVPVVLLLEAPLVRKSPLSARAE